MVDSIGSTPLQVSGSVPRVAAPAVAPTVQPTLQQATQQAPAPAATTQLSGIARTLAASPPVDNDRVGEIRKAIQNGSFPILPSTIADRLLALRMNWDGKNEAA